MATAEELLNSLSVSNSENEGHIIIGADRKITVPDTLKRLAVQYDHDIETVTFDCPRYWDGIDMSEMAVYIMYMLPDKHTGAYPVTNVTVDQADPNIMHFDWTISNNVTQLKGNISFLVCVKKTDEDNVIVNHWNSELCNDCYISEGLDCNDEILQLYSDVITQLLLRVGETEKNMPKFYEGTTISAPGLNEFAINTADKMHFSDELLDAKAGDLYYNTNELNLYQCISSEKTDKPIRNSSVWLCINNAPVKPYVEEKISGTANAVKGTASGTGIVTIEDVSPIPHDVKITVEAAQTGREQIPITKYFSGSFGYTTPEAINGVFYSIDDNGVVTAHGTPTEISSMPFHFTAVPDPYGIENSIELEAGAKYYFKALDQAGNPSSHRVVVIVSGPSNVSETFLTDYDYGQGVTFTVPPDESTGYYLTTYIEISPRLGTFEGLTFSPTLYKYVAGTYMPNIKISNGNTEEEHPVNSDGMVDGVKSIYPNMIISTSDGSDVLITCEYNKDINKALGSNDALGDIETALDSIIAIQNSLISGDGA